MPQTAMIDSEKASLGADGERDEHRGGDEQRPGPTHLGDPDDPAGGDRRGDATDQLGVLPAAVGVVGPRPATSGRRAAPPRITTRMTTSTSAGLVVFHRTISDTTPRATAATNATGIDSMRADDRRGEGGEQHRRSRHRRR